MPRELLRIGGLFELKVEQRGRSHDALETIDHEETLRPKGHLDAVDAARFVGTALDLHLVAPRVEIIGGQWRLADEGAVDSQVAAGRFALDGQGATSGGTRLLCGRV